MHEVQNILIFGTQEESEFRFCGDQNKQASDHTIVVTCEQASRKLDTIRFAPRRGKHLDESATEDHKAQIMSVTGSLLWIARICGPGMSYGVSKLQSAAYHQECRGLAK